MKGERKENARDTRNEKIYRRYFSAANISTAGVYAGTLCNISGGNADADASAATAATAATAAAATAAATTAATAAEAAADAAATFSASAAIQTAAAFAIWTATPIPTADASNRLWLQRVLAGASVIRDPESHNFLQTVSGVRRPGIPG